MNPGDLSAFTERDYTPIICQRGGELKASNPGSHSEEEAIALCLGFQLCKKEEI